jgi:glycosyltransferase involved in cell wall biosynthesis
MRILVVSNLYPPYYLGGYEIRCALVAEGLRQAGHNVRVLTSRYGLDCRGPIADEVNGLRIQRILGQYNLGPQDPVRWSYFLTMVRPQLRDAYNFLRVLDEFKPDLVNWWSVRGLTKAILPIPKMRGIPDIFCVEEPWIVEERTRSQLDERPPWVGLWGKEAKRWYWHPLFLWLIERWKGRLLKQGIDTAAIPFSPTQVCFVSEFLRDHFRAAGFDFPSTEVIYGGVPVTKFFYPREKPMTNQQPARFLYAGQIDPERGLHTAIEALTFLSQEGRSLATLTVVGEGHEPTYPREMREKVRNLGLSKKVVFLGKKTYEQMPEIYRRHDLLIAPSLRKEGLPLSMVEAMLSGCAVVCTGSGGAIEIAQLADLPLFPKGDALALSRILETLIDNPQALEQIARRGQNVALREFSSDRMMERLLNTFEKVFVEKQRRGHRGNRVGPDENSVRSITPLRA